MLSNECKGLNPMLINQCWAVHVIYSIGMVKWMTMLLKDTVMMIRCKMVSIKHVFSQYHKTVRNPTQETQDNHITVRLHMLSAGHTLQYW